MYYFDCMSAKSNLTHILGARSNTSATGAHSNVSTTGSRSIASIPVTITSSSPSVTMPTTSHERRLAARAAARANETASSSIRPRGNSMFPQHKLFPIPEEIRVLLGSYVEVVSTTCIRNLCLRFEMGPLKMRKCFPHECGCVHLPRDVRLCNSFLEYLRANVANGIDCLSAAQSCQHDYCKFWPCNLLVNKKLIKKQKNAIAVAAVAAVAAGAAAEAEFKFKQTAVFADLALMVSSEKPKSTYTECPEKSLMKVNNPMLYAVWMLPQYRSLTHRVFKDNFHKDYKSWNIIKNFFINSTNKVGCDEWACDVAEIEHDDHRKQYADFMSALLEIPLSRDIRVLGNQLALSIAKEHADIFTEYMNIHWKSGERLEILGKVYTFNSWLTVHPSYSSIYQLCKDGMLWRDAKKQIKGIRQHQHIEEPFDWENAEVVSGISHIAEIDISKKQSIMDSLLLMTSVDTTDTSEKKEIHGTNKTVKEIRVLQAPEYLDEQDSDLFIERDMQGRFAVYIRLEEQFSQSDMGNISEIWSKFRVGPARSSFVVAGREMYICISGSIKKVTGFCEMFEKFPGFIAALQKKQYVTNESLYVVPVHSTREFTRPGNKIQLTYVKESFSKKQYEDTGFDFAPIESFEDIRKGESGAHELCDILVNYFK